MKPWFGLTLLILNMVQISVYAKAAYTEQECRDIEQHLMEGDVAFISIENFLYQQVERATHSWTSHVGIVTRNHNRWMVAESSVMLSRLSPFCKFIGRSAGGQFSIRRLSTGVNVASQVKLSMAIRSRLERLYDFSFNFDGKGMFCSKFVYEIFQEAMGVEVGQIETFRELLAKSPDQDITFWQVWFLGIIPWDRRTVTPSSQYLDPQFETVIETVNNFSN